jgi:kynureninase
MLRLDDITGDSNSLASHYSQFRVSERTLLTGHSHQAWPDVSLNGQQQAWLDAAEQVDDKWSVAFEKARKVKTFYNDLLGDSDPANYTLASSTHDLLVRFLSATDLKNNPRIVTTDGEFHSMRRQLDRLAEEAVEIVRVPVDPVDSLSERVAAEITPGTAAVMMSAVMFKDAAIVPHLSALMEKSKYGVPILVDVYHALNVVPFDLESNGLQNAFIVGGGYKYCQFGEGNCFLRVPPGCETRPIITGWYAEFGDMEKVRESGLTRYPSGGERFQGSTYDPSSHYRACSVIDFFNEQNLTPSLLRDLSQYQLGILVKEFDLLGCDPSLIKRKDVPIESIGGFLSLKTTHADELQAGLKAGSVWTDQRDGYLRLGPAPYVSDAQLRDAIVVLGKNLSLVGQH